MDPECKSGVEVNALRCLLLEIAQERTLCSLLESIVQRFAEQPHVALVRI